MDRIQELIALLKSDPYSSFLKFALAMEFRKQGHLAEAEKFFQSILTNEPSYAGVYYHYGAFLEEQQRVEEAVEVYEKGILILEQQNDPHALSELRGALINLKMNLDE